MTTADRLMPINHWELKSLKRGQTVSSGKPPSTVIFVRVNREFWTRLMGPTPEMCFVSFHDGLVLESNAETGGIRIIHERFEDERDRQDQGTES